MAGGQDGARRKPGFLTFPIWLPHVTGADTYEIRHCPYIDVNVVPDSQRRQKMNPHLTSIYISSYRYSAHVRKANPYTNPRSERSLLSSRSIADQRGSGGRVRPRGRGGACTVDHGH